MSRGTRAMLTPNKEHVAAGRLRRRRTASVRGSSARLALSRLVRTRRDRWVLGTGAVFVVAALVVSGLLIYRSLHPAKQITAYFAQTIGVYPQSTVRCSACQWARSAPCSPTAPVSKSP